MGKFLVQGISRGTIFTFGGEEGAMDVWRARCESGCGVVLLVGMVCERDFRGDVWVSVVGVERDLDCGVVDKWGDTRLPKHAGRDVWACQKHVKVTVKQSHGENKVSVGLCSGAGATERKDPPARIFAFSRG